MFCPFRSTAEKEIACSENCALFTQNNQCAIKNIGNVDFEDLQHTIHNGLQDIKSELYEVRCK